MNTRYLLRIIFYFGTFCLFLSFFQEDFGDYNIRKITTAFENYIDTVHPQKIYLHVDKGQYIAREKIRINSYLLDGTNHKPDSADKHIFVELIDPYKRRAQILRIRQYNGVGSGEFYLSDTVPEGIYQIRAYTNRMKNYGPEFYFNRNISVRNHIKKYMITDKEARSNIKIQNKNDKEKLACHLSFFPEGGQLLSGVKSKIAFKALNGLERSIPAQGEIYNSKKVKITSFSSQHNGMGFFYLTPQKNETYYAQVLLNNEEVRKVLLPKQMDNLVSLQLASEENLLLFHVLSNKIRTNDRTANEFILIGQERGTIKYTKCLNLLDGDTLFTINKEIFAPGVVHFALLNNRLLPVSERLCFINRPQALNYSIEATDNDNYIDLFINTKVSGNYSKSVINASLSVLLLNDGKSLPRENIISELLLTSDLPGIIEDPLYYFQQNKKNSEDDADLLMLTNGWKRYYWPDIIEGNYPLQKYESEQSITVKGKITREVIEIPYSNADVKLYVMNQYNDEFATLSDKKGEFIFKGLNYNDTIDAKIKARKPDGGKNLLVTMDESPTDKICEYTGEFYLTTISELNKKEYRRITNEITRKKIEKRQRELDSIYSGSIYGRPDYVLWGEDFPLGSSNLLEIIQGRVSGVNVTGNSVTIRGIATIYGSTEPLVLVDGIPSGPESLMSISPGDVDRIEFLKGPSAAMYGSRGANGVIAVYTKRGYTIIKGQIYFSILGYHVEEAFSSPSKNEIKTIEEQNHLPYTIFWAPRIILDTEHESKITFFAPKTGVKMILVLEGIDTNGNPGYSLLNLSR
jgi:TonB-dependent SusC/RagA subfamily outer membrane receptor